MEGVNVSRGVLGALVAVAATSLLAVAFLLGRLSGPPPAARPEPPATSTASSPAPTPAPPPPASEAEPRVSFAPPPPDSAPPVAPLAFEEPARSPGPAPKDAPPPSPSAADPERAAVAAYLEAIDRIQPAEVGGNAESAANELATALAKGDTSGLDAMIRDSEAAKARLAAVAPPPACAAHYRECAGSLDDGLEMLRALRDAVASPDPAAALLGVGARATGLRDRAEALRREDAALRRRYGLAR